MWRVRAATPIPPRHAGAGGPPPRRESTIILTGDIDDITALAANYLHVRVEGV